MRNEAVLPVAQFLGRAWSGKSDLSVKLDINATEAFAGRDDSYKPVIVVPPPSRFPTTELITAYRLWRATLWHESMHHYYGLPELYRIDTNVKHILNAVEDYRIEQRGVKEYPGMSRELDLRRAVYYSLAREPRDDIEAYIQLLLLRAVKHKSVPKCVVDAVKYTKEAVEQGVDSETIAKRVCEMLGVEPNEYRLHMREATGYAAYHHSKKLKKHELEGAVVDWLKAKQQAEKQCEQGGLMAGEPKQEEQAKQGSLTASEQLTEQKIGRQETDESIVGEAEELLTVPSEVMEEIEQVRIEDKRIEHGRKGAASEVMEAITLPSKLDVDESKLYDHELITHLVSQMRKLRKGWKEVSSYTGEFDVDSYVARHSKVFVDEERLKVKDFKVLILVDHSGSICGYDEKYKSACIALAEALNALKIPFAIYVFTEYRTYTQIYLVKGFNEKWTRMNAKRLAQIRPDGGTPLGEVYVRLKRVVMKNKGKLYFITLTDGEPSTPAFCSSCITELKKYCRMVAVAFGHSMEEAVKLAMNLKFLGYDRYVALDDIMKLSEKVIGLLGE